MASELMTIEGIRNGLRIIRERRNDSTNIYSHGALELAEELLKHHDALEAENAKLREALQPFADKWERVRKPFANGSTWTGGFPYAHHKAAWEALRGDSE